MRRTAEAVIKTLFVVDREAGRLFVMERTTRLILAPRAGDLHRPPDQRRQGDARPQLVQPLRGEGHQPPSRLREGLGEGMSASTRSEEHTSELQSLMRISYAVFCLQKNKKIRTY